MATDATGTPTPLGIPTYNVNADAPSGNGFNAAMAEIDTLISERILSPGGIATGEWAVWNGSTWARSSAVTRATTSRTIYTSGSGTYNLPTGVQAILVEVLGGGATGGTAQTGSNNAQAAASGGWGGSYAASLITSPAASYAYTVGAGGAAIAGGGTAGNGNAGGDSNFGSGTVVGKGGAAGAGDNNSTPSHGTPYVIGISAQNTGNVGNIIVPGGPPGEGWGIAANFLIGGAGGSGGGPYGGPGAAAAAATNGANGLAPPSGGYGAGSSGSVAGAFSSGDLAVSAGQGGLIVITEFH